MIDKNQVEMTKIMYPHGTIVKVIMMNEKRHKLSSTEGFVNYIDDDGIIYVKRNNGTKVGMIYSAEKRREER